MRCFLPALALVLFLAAPTAPALAAPIVPGEVPDDPFDVRPLTEGMSVPRDLEVSTREGEAFDLSAALAKGPTVLIFYRGGW